MNLRDAETQRQAKSKSDYESRLHVVAAQVMREVWRFDFTDRQRRVVAMVLECSIGWGRPSVRFSSQGILGQMVGLPESHVSVTIKELVGLGVLQRRQAAGRNDGVELVVMADSRFWSCKLAPLVDGEFLARLREDVRRFNGVQQLELIEREQGLREALAEQALLGGNLPVNNEGKAAGVRLTESVSTESVSGGESYGSGKSRADLHVNSITCDSNASSGSRSITGDLHVNQEGPGTARAKRWSKPRFDGNLLGEVRALCRESDWADTPPKDGAEGKKGWGAWWTSVVRYNPDRVRSALAEYRTAVREGWKIDKPGPWMKDFITRLDNAERSVR